MYEVFYGLKEKPFSMLPDPGFLFLSKKHQAALTLLEYGLLNHVGFCVISGEPGAGKTTILRALLERVEEGVTVGLITNTHQSFGGLLDWILSVFDLHKPNLSHVEMHQIFMDFLIDEYANNRSVLLIVDEAQNMKAETLEELRMLSNVNSEKDQLLQVVLSGQPGLKETLRRPELMQFAQRIAVDFHLDALSLEETCGYIQHRLVTAGAEKDIFTPAACERIHTYSGGTPRLINLLCETVMVYGFADEKDVIDIDLVDEMVLERMKDSVVPIKNRDIAKKSSNVSKLVIKDFPWIQPEGGTKGLKPEANDTPPAILKTTAKAAKPVISAKKKPVASLIEKDRKSAEVKAKVAVKEKPVATRAPGAAAKVEQKKSVSRSDDKKEHKPAAIKSSPVVEGSTKTPSAAPQKTISQDKNTDDKSQARVQLIKYGVIAGILALLLIVGAVLMKHKSDQDAAIAKEKILLLQKQRDEESARMQKLQVEAESLKEERDAAIAKGEAEKIENEKAIKLAAEKAALDVKKVEDKLKAKAKEFRLKRAADAKLEAERIAAKIKEARLIERARLDEEMRLKEQAEALRLESEREEELIQEKLIQEQLRKERARQEALQSSKNIDQPPVVAEETIKKKGKTQTIALVQRHALKLLAAKHVT